MSGLINKNMHEKTSTVIDNLWAKNAKRIRAFSLCDGTDLVVAHMPDKTFQAVQVARDQQKHLKLDSVKTQFPNVFRELNQ